jgi:hypothetical protein
MWPIPFSPSTIRGEAEQCKLIAGLSYISDTFSSNGVLGAMTNPTGTGAIGDYCSTGVVGGWNGEFD